MKIRIKKDVDLKELKKYGYREWEKGFTKRVMSVKAEDTSRFYENIEVRKEDRIIRSHLYNDLSNFDWFSQYLTENHYIQDLVESGLTEIVEV